MSDNYPECDCFAIGDHRRAICRGEVRKPLNGPNSINAYRKKWGFEPIESATAAVVDWVPTMRSRGFGDTIAKLTSAVGIKPCGGCKGRQALLNKMWPYSPTLNSDPISPVALKPLVNPKRHLIFHLLPLGGKEWNWHWHLDQIRKHSHKFDSIHIGVGIDSRTATIDAVQKIAADIPVTSWVVRQNHKRQGEMTTFGDLLALVKSDDPNSIVLRGHTKGVTKSPTAIEQEWARLMWDTCMDLPSVEAALDSHLMAGSMRCQEPLVRRSRGNWFYAGSFYWFRSQVFQRQWDCMEPGRWFVEYWPGLVADLHETACLCHDFTQGSVLSADYWQRSVMPDWLHWQETHR